MTRDDVTAQLTPQAPRAAACWRAWSQRHTKLDAHHDEVLLAFTQSLLADPERMACHPRMVGSVIRCVAEALTHAARPSTNS